MSRSRLDVLAHELRSPVAALAAIAAAYPDASEERRSRLLELACAAVAGIDRLLEDVVRLSVRTVRLDAGALARDAAETAAVGGAPVTAVTEASLWIDGDPQRLRQALDNLIGNALGHSRARGRVTVTSRREGEEIAISVADEGEGIAQADLERIFEPGLRLTDARPGSGLGLAVVREIARGHGGDVEVASSPGQGATFTLLLPAASAAS